jgi:zinc/manganese transport system permease protein
MRMPAESLSPAPSLNPLHDIGLLLEYHFMVNALEAGSVVAVMAGLIGWLMVLRRESFAGHSLAMMAFPGAAAAALLGAPAAWGYFAFCGAGAVTIGRLPSASARSWSTESASIGSVQALALGLGFLFVSLYGGVLGDLESLLFGNLLGVSDSQVLVLAGVTVAVLAVLAVIARPLLLASVDAEVAASRGVQVGRLSAAFLVLLGLAVAATSQITGPLLVFALLVMPAASAQAITNRPLASLLLTVAIGLAVVWLGLGAAYFSVYPPSFFIGAVSFAGYLLARLLAASRRAAAPGPARGEPPAPAGAVIA